MKRFLLIAATLGLLLTSGCTTNWAHNRRHIYRIREQFAELHRDIDRTIFDLEPYPYPIKEEDESTIYP